MLRTFYLLILALIMAGVPLAVCQADDSDFDINAVQIEIRINISANDDDIEMAEALPKAALIFNDKSKKPATLNLRSQYEDEIQAGHQVGLYKTSITLTEKQLDSGIYPVQLILLKPSKGKPSTPVTLNITTNSIIKMDLKTAKALRIIR